VFKVEVRLAECCPTRSESTHDPHTKF